MEQAEFEDRVAFGGFHLSGGMYDSASGSKQLQADGNDHIPFHSLPQHVVA